MRTALALLAARIGSSVLFLASLTAAQTVVYVDDSATGADDGTSWTDAYTDLSVALDAAVAFDELWVAAGSYRSTSERVPGDPRSVSFVVRNDIAVYGGFAGTETALADRAGLFAQTILTGEIQGNGDLSDNAYHVVTTWGRAVIDGFVIERGNANGPADQEGGGILCSVGPNGQLANLVLSNCTIRFNSAGGGGGYFQPGGSVLMKRNRIMRNTAASGAGILLGGVGLWAFNCELGYNVASSIGGGIRVLFSIPNFTNSLFHHNSAELGGAAYIGDGESFTGGGTFVNCTITANHATGSGGGVFAANNSSTPASTLIRNSIVWGNTAGVSDPELSGLHTVNMCDAPYGTLSFYADPLFVPSTYTLSSVSPCIDAGNVHFLTADDADLDADGDTSEPIPLDLGGDPRVLDFNVDMGVDEFKSEQ